MEKPIAHQTVDQIFALFSQYGEEEYGENLSQQEHMIQAALMAQKENQPEEVVIAALLHDIDHLYGHQVNNDRMGDFGIVDHEALGAEYLLAKGFSNKVAALVKGHVIAKRYLCFADLDYMTALSHASRETLKQQGGPMQKDEAEHFRNSIILSLTFVCVFGMSKPKSQTKLYLQSNLLETCFYNTLLNSFSYESLQSTTRNQFSI